MAHFQGLLLLVLRRVKQPIWHGSISSPQTVTHRGENGGKTPLGWGPLNNQPPKKHPPKKSGYVLGRVSSLISIFQGLPPSGGKKNNWGIIFPHPKGILPGLIPMAHVSLLGCPTQLCFHLTRCSKLIYQLSQHRALFAEPLGQVPETCPWMSG